MFRSQAFYITEYAQCMPRFNNALLYDIFNDISFGILISQTLLIITANCFILRVISITPDTPSRKALITLSCLSAVFLLSYTPIFILWGFWLVKASKVWMFILSQVGLALNVVSNPVIYTITNSSFRQFIQAHFVNRVAVIRRRGCVYINSVHRRGSVYINSVQRRGTNITLYLRGISNETW